MNLLQRWMSLFSFMFRQIRPTHKEAAVHVLAGLYSGTHTHIMALWRSGLFFSHVTVPNMGLFIINLFPNSLKKNHIQLLCFFVQSIIPVEHYCHNQLESLSHIFHLKWRQRTDLFPPKDVSTEYVILTEFCFTCIRYWIDLMNHSCLTKLCISQ